LNALLSLKTWFSVGARRRPAGAYRWIFLPFALLVSVYVISAATFIIIDPWTLTVLFFAGMLALGFLTTGAFEDSDDSKPSRTDLALALLSVGVGLYFAAKADAIVDRIVLFDPLGTADVAFATIVFLLTLEITRRATGLGLTAIVLVFVAYNLWGDHLSGVMQHGEIGFRHLLEIAVFTTDGIFGLPLRVAATYAFMFVLFGTLLQACRGGDFFYDFAAALSGRRAGGPAKIAVVSSGLYGMVSGSPTADVVTTGSITIPIMKRLGYSGRYAGAIEVAASTGGSIMPPVMGTAAFIMVDFTGIEYREIAITALIPAVLYYVCVYAQVHFSARRLGLGALDGPIPRMLPTLREGGLFIVPLAVLTAALLYHYTPTMVAVFGLLAVLAVAMLRAKTRVGPGDLIDVLAETCYRMVPVVGACAAAGLVIAGITMTGLAAKFAHLVYGVTDAQLLPTLLVAAALTIVLGMGMPTPSAYILAAALVAPMIEKLGVSLLATHMFILYYAVMSALTPPVAVAAYAAAPLADDNPLYIAALAVKFALAAFLVPFVFIYGPELLLEGPWHATLITLVTAIAGLVVLAAAIEGFLFRPLAAWQRLSLAAAGFALVLPSTHLAAAGTVVVAAFIGHWRLRGKRVSRRPGRGDTLES